MRTLLIALFTSIVSIVAAQCYVVNSVTYVPDTTSATHYPIVIDDDQWSQPLPIGFTFCFFGNQYYSVLVGSNGILTFDTSLAGAYCMWPIPPMLIPNTVVPDNSIMLPWQDLRIDSTSVISYWISGVAPNRVFTVEYENMKMYGCTSDIFSGRVSLHESTNIIEMQIDQKTTCISWNGGRAVQGIVSPNGLQAIAVSGRNANSWSVVQDGQLFVPICDVCTGVGLNETEADNNIRVFPNPSNGTINVALLTGHSITTIEIIDALGRVTERRTIEDGTPQQVRFESVATGCYYVRMLNQTQDLIKAEKMIVE